MDDLAPLSEIASVDPLTPETLRDLLKIDHPSGVITIQGVARETNLWSKGGASFVYGRLILGSASLKFRSPAELAPAEGEAVMMRGTLQIASASQRGEDWRATHEILFVASVVGTWETRQTAAPRTDPLTPREVRTPLADLLAAHGMGKLVILATDTARQDIMQSLKNEEIQGRPEFVDVSFGSEEDFVATLRRLRGRQDIAALGISRGGGGGQEAIGDSREVIDALNGLGVPYYVAFGHAANLWLIDKHADQSFHTPSAFGTAIARALKKIAYEKRLLARIEALEAEQRHSVRISKRTLLLIIGSLLAAFAMML